MLGQALLAKRMGKQRLVAETGAGQHGVATATAAALLGLECVVYMGEVDMERQELNVFRMRLLGAEVRPALSGSRTLKDAINEAMRDWVATVETSHYCLGSVMGPHPYPWMVRELHRVIGDEAREQCRALLGPRPRRRHRVRRRRLQRHRALLGLRRLPAAELVGVEPAGGAAVGHGVPGIVHGSKSYLLQDEYGQVDGGRVDLGRPRLPGRRARARPPGRDRAGPATRRSPTPRCSTPSSCSPAPRGSSPPSSPPTRWPGCCGRKDELAGKVVLLNLSGRGDKDVAQVADILDRGADG